MNPVLSVEELKSIYSALGKASREEVSQLINRLVQAVNGSVLPPALLNDSEDIKMLEEKLTDRMYTLVSERLIINNPDVPLVASGDLTDFVSGIDGLISDFVSSSELADLPENMREYVMDLQAKDKKHLVRITAKNVEDVLIRELSDFNGENAYDRQWRLIRTVLTLCQERGVSSIDHLSLRELGDELARRYYGDKNEFRAGMLHLYGYFVSEEGVRNLFVKPMLEILKPDVPVDLPPEFPVEFREFDEEAEMMSELRANLPAAQAVLDEYISGEVSRIWGK